MEIKDQAHWKVADQFYAHGIGVKLDPVEMESLMRCICPQPVYDAFDICQLCDRKKSRGK